MCTVEDLKEMEIPLGPRKKIAKFVKERVNKLVRQIPPRPLFETIFIQNVLITFCSFARRSPGEERPGGEARVGARASRCTAGRPRCQEASCGKKQLLGPCGLQLL